MVQEVAPTADKTVRHSLRDQPMATLAIVAALGFALEISVGASLHSVCR